MKLLWFFEIFLILLMFCVVAWAIAGTYYGIKKLLEGKFDPPKPTDYKRDRWLR